MSFTLWFTGIPCSGKTTLSSQIFFFLTKSRLKVEILDGDYMRALSPHLSFSREDRDMHVRHLGLISRFLNEREVISIVAAISPYEAIRQENRSLIGRYVEVFCQCPLEVAEQRDTKGLYHLARTGKIRQFTGVSDPYEEPRSAEIIVHTDRQTIEESVAKIIRHLERHEFIPIRKEISQA